MKTIISLVLLLLVHSLLVRAIYDAILKIKGREIGIPMYVKTGERFDPIPGRLQSQKFIIKAQNL